MCFILIPDQNLKFAYFVRELETGYVVLGDN